MTDNKLYAKLRYYNRKNYLMLFLCTVLSVMLITSYALIYLSPTVQNVLPAGGDSRKQAVMIFAVAIVGCAIFSTYASSLFLKYKSREIGILMALGEQKGQLKKMLFSEIMLVAAAACVMGLILSYPLSYGIWRIFQLLIVDTREMGYQAKYAGLFFGVGFSALLVLCIFLLAVRFINRTNVMDIIYEQRKSEPVRDVGRWSGIAGIILLVLGFVLGYLVPMVVLDLFHFYLPSVWNAVYLISAVGIYQMMTFLVVHSKRGKHPRKYYRNLISTSMMRFLGRQTVRNMCVIILLTGGALFAAFYLPVTIMGVKENVRNNPVDYLFTYQSGQIKFRQSEIEELAKEHQVNLTDYQELPSLNLQVDGYDWVYQKSGKVDMVYHDVIGTNAFFNAEDLSKLLKKTITVKPGEFMQIANVQSAGSGKSSITRLTDPVTGEQSPVKYAGVVEFGGRFLNTPEGIETCYVLSPEDFARYGSHLKGTDRNVTVAFGVEHWEETYGFAKDLKDEIIRRYPGETVNDIMDRSIELAPDNPELTRSWAYYPLFKPLQSQDYMKNMAVFFMLFVYIAVICFTSVGIIAYTRGVTIAISQRHVFVDLRRLGADNRYIDRCMKNQLRRIFIYPFLTGSIAALGFIMMILYANDGRISVAEGKATGINLIIMAGLGLYLFLVYSGTCKKFRAIIGES
ncbi:ABC transporter permease [Diplocloster hominis]|uniref:ABC transporter permease n=1 Tax=Diplocloster hominis TaxID=3079010 RepID=UPI0031B9F7CE